MSIPMEDLKKAFLTLLKDETVKQEIGAALASFFAIKGVEDTIKEVRKLTDAIRQQTEAINKRLDLLEKTMQKEHEETRKHLEAFRKEMQAMRRDFNMQIEALNKRMDSFEKSLELLTKRMDSFEKSLELMSKRMDDFEAEMRRLRQDFNLSISALGARWGFSAEEAFREGIRGVLGELGFTVDKWEVYDKEGTVFGVPGVIETDVLIRDEQHILIEIKSSMSRGDVAAFINKAKLYERLVGVKPLLVIISPFVYDDARERALQENIKVYTRVREFKPL
ncbi:MAG: DUF3782 domain-containing protein [Candidatus Freyrarchaeum guaymaensis]|nr:DUF3782 domain-containing protein [Candidatus Sigynarchaeota archaeon]